jgi:hypothetical protein
LYALFASVPSDVDVVFTVAFLAVLPVRSDVPDVLPNVLPVRLPRKQDVLQNVPASS